MDLYSQLGGPQAPAKVPAGRRRPSLSLGTARDSVPVSPVINNSSVQAQHPERGAPFRVCSRPRLWTKKTVAFRLHRVQLLSGGPLRPTQLVSKTIARTVSVGAGVSSISKVASWFPLFLVARQDWRERGSPASLFGPLWEWGRLSTEGGLTGQHSGVSRKGWRWAHWGCLTHRVDSDHSCGCWHAYCKFLCSVNLLKNPTAAGYTKF